MDDYYTKDISAQIGTQTNGYSNFFINTSGLNRRYESKLGAYRLEWKYGLLTGYLSNTSFYTENGSSVPPWILTNVSSDNIADPGESGLTFECLSDIPQAESTLFQGGAADLPTGSVLSLECRYDLGEPFLMSDGSPANREFYYTQIYFRITIYDGSNYWYLQDDGSWSTSFNTYGVTLYKETTQVRVEGVNPTPVDGQLNVLFGVYRTMFPDATDPADYYKNQLDINYVNIEITREGEDFPLGETHTSEFTDNPNPKTNAPRQVILGDNEDGFYLGSLYKQIVGPSVTYEPTTKWSISGEAGDPMPLLSLATENQLRMYQSKTRVVQGSFFGRISLKSVINIYIDESDTGLTYLLNEMTYDSQRNITRFKASEFIGDYIASGITTYVIINLSESDRATLET